MKAHCAHCWRILVACTLLLKAAPLRARMPQEVSANFAAQTASANNQKVMSVRIVSEDGRVISESPANLPIQP